MGRAEPRQRTQEACATTAPRHRHPPCAARRYVATRGSAHGPNRPVRRHPAESGPGAAQGHDPAGQHRVAWRRRAARADRALVSPGGRDASRRPGRALFAAARRAPIEGVDSWTALTLGELLRQGNREPELAPDDGARRAGRLRGGARAVPSPAHGPLAPSSGPWWAAQSPTTTSGAGGSTNTRGNFRCRQRRRYLESTTRARDDDAQGHPSNVGLSRLPEAIPPIRSTETGTSSPLIPADQASLGEERIEVASLNPAAVSDRFLTRCAAPAISVSMVRIRACAKGADSGRFEATPFQKQRRLPNTYTACTRPRTVRHPSFHGEKTGSSSGPSMTSG